MKINEKAVFRWNWEFRVCYS